jgi:hypothetical protein
LTLVSNRMTRDQLFTKASKRPSGCDRTAIDRGTSRLLYIRPVYKARVAGALAILSSWAVAFTPYEFRTVSAPALAVLS